MQAPSPLGTPSTPGPTESVERPPPGLARGHWEAPSWAFVIIAAAAVLGSLVWLLLAVRSRRVRP